MFSLKLVFYYSVRTYFLHSYCFENGLRDLLYKSNLAFGILSMCSVTSDCLHPYGM